MHTSDIYHVRNLRDSGDREADMNRDRWLKAKKLWFICDAVKNWGRQIGREMIAHREILKSLN